MADSINKQTREKLTLGMQVLNIEIADIEIPLLNRSVTQIILDINHGEIAHIRPLYKLK